jgi:DNA-binding response OmpR family regulator
LTNVTFSRKCGVLSKEKSLGKILLVDGNSPVTKFLALMLKHSGYEVVVSHDHEQAVKPSSCSEVNLVALSAAVVAEVPEAVHKLREAASYPVMVYGLVDSCEEARRQTGADYWINNFYDPDDFLKAVKTALPE